MCKKIKHYFLLIVVLCIGILACKTNKKTEASSPDDYLSPIQKLVVGNQRFVKGKSVHPDESLARIKEIKQAQHPFAVIVSCSDSRVPPELIFDQGFGNIFSVRTAGNVIGNYELGSIEYAVEHLHCPLVVVMGHQSCGAVDAFLKSDKKELHHNHIQNIIDYLAAEREIKTNIDSLKNNLNFAVKANVQHGVNFLTTAKPILHEAIKSNKVKIIGAVYSLENGVVNFVE